MPEKEYVLGNKTKDLLAYSFVVTKPIGDKTLEISEVIKMLGAIKSLPPEARDDILAQYLDRLEKANSRQGFPKSALHTYIKTVRETAVSIVKNVHAANDCSFQTEYDRRLQSAPEAGGDQPSPRIYQREENGSLDQAHHGRKVHDPRMEEEGHREGKDPPAPGRSQGL